MKSRNKMQKEGQKRLTGLQGQNLAKILEENVKKLMVEPLAKSEREKS